MTMLNDLRLAASLLFKDRDAIRPVLTTIGLVVGMGGSFAAARGLSTLLFGVTPGDVSTFATTAALLSITAALACFMPSRRATRVDPVIALRSE